MPYVQFKDNKGKKHKEWAGAFSRFFNIEPKRPESLVVFEIQPSLEAKAQGGIPASTYGRSLEIWKEPGVKQASIIITTEQPDAGHYAATIKSAYPGSVVRKIKETEPRWVRQLPDHVRRGIKFLAFDVEQSHSLPFCQYEKSGGMFVDDVIRSLGAETGVWVQIVFIDATQFHYEFYAEATAMKMKEVQRVIQEGNARFKGVRDPTDSTVFKLLPGISSEYFDYGQSPAVMVSVRGLILTPTGRVDLTPATSKIHISNDTLQVYSYPDIRMVRWLRTRCFPDPTDELRAHRNNGFLKEWGKGRELVPDLFVTPNTLNNFIHLPTDLALSGLVRFTRGSAIPEMTTEEKEGIRVGE